MHNLRHQRTPLKKRDFSNSRKSPDRLALNASHKEVYSFKGTSDHQLHYTNAHKLPDGTGKLLCKHSSVALLGVLLSLRSNCCDLVRLND